MTLPTVERIIVVGRSRVTSHHLSPGKILISEARRPVDLLVGSLICFVSQLIQLVTLFLNACDYEKSTWFVHGTLVVYYISFTPQMSLFSSIFYHHLFINKFFSMRSNLANMWTEFFVLLSTSIDYISQ